MSDNKQIVADIDHSLYDFKDIENEKDFYRMEEGLTEETVLKVSEEKNDPEWMRDFRLECLKLYNEIKMPNWGPSIEGLDMDKISSYVRHKSDMKGKWEDVPEDIKNTFEKLGIPRLRENLLQALEPSTTQSLFITT